MVKMFLNRPLVAIVAAALVSSTPGALTSTAYAQSGERLGAGLGGVLGGIIGNSAGRRGNRTVTTILGASLGALVGARIARGLSTPNRQRLAGSTRETLSTGQPRAWAGDGGVSGRTEVIGTGRRSTDAAVPVLKDRVTTLPPLEFIDAAYVSPRGSIVRGGPGADYRPVANLKKSEVVSVTGKVQGQPWLLIAQNGVGSGFVPEGDLRPSDVQPVVAAAPTGTVETRTTQVDRPCRTVKQTVVQNGVERSETVTACQTATGWEVS